MTPHPQADLASVLLVALVKIIFSNVPVTAPSTFWQVQLAYTDTPLTSPICLVIWRSYSAGSYLFVGILTLVDLLGKICGSGADTGGNGDGFGSLIASGLSFTGFDGLLGGVMKVGDSGVLGTPAGSLN